MGTATASVPYTYGSPIWGDMLTAYNGTSIGYDGSGNPLVHGTTQYTWEHGRQLKSMLKDGTTWNFTYNNAGLRTGRTGGGTTYKYVYNGGQLMQMTKDNQTANFAYDAAGTPLTMKVGENTYYYVTNLQGDITGLVNASGATVVSYAYTAYGVVTATGDTNVIALNPLTYRGYVYDAETGLYYLQSRYYDPAVGRFINADGLVSTGQGFVGNNMFAYCLNNPVNLVDRNGLNPEAAAGWASSMWWLCTADTALPIGDIIYVIGGVVFLYKSTQPTQYIDYSTAPGVVIRGKASHVMKGGSTASSSATSPKPPKNNKNKKLRKESGVLKYDPNFDSGTTYNNDGIRVDYEYNGNGTGNVHIHTKDGKFYYSTDGTLRTGLESLAALAEPYIQRILSDPQVQKGIMKALRYIKSHGGEIP